MKMSVKVENFSLLAFFVSVFLKCSCSLTIPTKLYLCLLQTPSHEW